MFKFNDLPFEQFKKVGLEKKDVLSLPVRTLNALLTGRRTSLLRFRNLDIGGRQTDIEGKLSLKKGLDGKPSLSLTPVRMVPDNRFKLNEKELEKLNADKVGFVEKTLKNSKGGTYDVMVSLDKDTNTFNAIRKDAIKPPLEINGEPLSEKQKIDFKNGRPIKVGNDEFILNPNTELGVSGPYGDTRKIRSMVSAENYKYDGKQLAIDVALLASGLGGVVLLGHLIRLTNASMAAHRNNASNPLYWDALDNVRKDIQQNKTATGATPDEKKVAEIVNERLKPFDMGIHEGKLVDFGKAKYEFNETKPESFFVKLEQNGKEKTLWGKDFERALENSNVQKGDDVKLEYQGKENILVPKPVMDDKGETISSKNVTMQKNIWDIYKKPETPAISMDKGKKVSTKLGSTDDASNVKQVRPAAKNANADSLKLNNPDIKKSIEEKPKHQEKKSRGKGPKI